DNGIYEEGVASAPQNFTNLLLGYYAAGQNCGINVLCNAANVDLKAVDMGVIGKVDSPNILDYKLMEGTRNFANEHAMPREIAEKAIEIGISLAKYAYDNGYEIIGTGEVGIGNTSSSSACTMAALNITAHEAVGRGAGLSDEAFEQKKEVLTKALTMHAPFEDEIDIVSKVGGLDIAGLTGLFIGAAIYRLPIVIDGYISAVAALLAYKINPLTKEFMIPSHLSEEPGYIKIMEFIGLEPLLNLKMRLGEGTGCPLAMQIVDASLKIINEMLSFDASVLDEESYKKNLEGK
ncbi:MAG: nicotinate-nucleotide--dimethylbenzimidazole phosphoribosyltransferase, partial [Peptostreptococcaceae bacterium]|nr:nicotinate-nucleotide--dimethylbenzimidazole phosphoribosyltransferase [Peptostreptococcaceae bacterium]